MERFWKLWKKSWYWLFFGAVVLLTLYMDIYMARFVLDGDTSEYLNRAYEIAQTNDLFTRNVYLTTEVRPFHLGAVFSAFFHFTSDWTLVRILGMILLQVYYVGSFFYLCKQARISRPSTVFAAGMLLLPFSASYGRIVLYHLYYILYVTNAFWLLGLTIHLFHASRNGFSYRNLPSAILLGGLWFFVGCNGIRHMMILGIPMLAFAAYQLICTLNEYRLENGQLVGGQMPILKNGSVRLMLILIGSCLCFLPGFLINTRLLVNYFGVRSYSSTFYLPFMEPSRYTEIFNGFLTAAGVRYSVLSMVGPRGISLIAALFSVGYLCLAAFRKCKKREDLASQLFSGMLAATMVSTTLIFIFDSAARHYELYYIPALVWMFPTLAAEWDSVRNSRTPLGRKLLVLLTCACLLFQGAYSILFLRTQDEKMDRWDGLTFKEMDVVDSVHDCVTFMQENGYTHAMIDYWYANTMKEITNGELAVAPLVLPQGNEGGLIMQEWGTSKTDFQADRLPEKLVIFIPHNECDRFKQLFPQVPLVHDGWRFCGYLADADLLLNPPILNER